jgi:Domain of unknown function (DUF4118)
VKRRRRGDRARPEWLIAVGLLAPFLVAFALSPIRASLDGADVVLVLVTVIVAIAATGRRVAGALAAASSSVWFDFFFTRPYDHLSIVHRGDIETTVLLLAVGIAVTELAARGRRQRRLAAEGSNHLAMLHDFAEMIATGEYSDFVVIRAAAELSELLYLRDCRFEPGVSDGHLPSLEPGGEVLISGRRWDAGDLGLPGSELELLVESGGRAQGRFLLVPTPGKPVSLERRVVAVAIASQVGASLSGGAPGT